MEKFVDTECLKEDNNHICSYYLYSIVIHSGFYQEGHYYIIIKDFNTNKYYKLDDQKISNYDFKNNKKNLYGGYINVSKIIANQLSLFI